MLIATLLHYYIYTVYAHRLAFVSSLSTIRDDNVSWNNHPGRELWI